MSLTVKMCLRLVMSVGLLLPVAGTSQVVVESSDDAKMSGVLDLSGKWMMYGLNCDSSENFEVVNVTINYQGGLLAITMDDECKDNKWYSGSTWISGLVPDGLVEGQQFNLNAHVYNKRDGSITKSTVLSSYLYDNGNMIVTQSSNWKYVNYFYRVE